MPKSQCFLPLKLGTFEEVRLKLAFWSFINKLKACLFELLKMFIYLFIIIYYYLFIYYYYYYKKWTKYELQPADHNTIEINQWFMVNFYTLKPTPLHLYSSSVE